jgi:hypothetical protein
MCHRVALVSTDVTEERIVFIGRVTVIGELGITANVVFSSPIFVALMMELIRSSELGFYKSHTSSHPRRYSANLYYQQCLHNAQ